MAHPLKTWRKMEEKPDGRWCRVQWQNAQFPAWRIIEQETESCGIRYIIVSTAGSAFDGSYDSLALAKAAFAQAMARYI